jgi:hypothetical protein
MLVGAPQIWCFAKRGAEDRSNFFTERLVPACKAASAFACCVEGPA